MSDNTAAPTGEGAKAASTSSTGIGTPPSPKTTTTDNHKRTNKMMIRFHFIRHGETEANLQKIVLGQTESPLTRQGKEQAKLVGKAFVNKKIEHIWGSRIYCSDLQRAKETSKIISRTVSAHTSDDGDEGSTTKQQQTLIIQPDVLLRERAKGIREGKLKSLNEDECLKIHKMEEDMKGSPIPFPLLENDDQVWERFQTFLTNVVTKVVHEYSSSQRLTQQVESTDKQQVEEANIINILVVTHSGAIRILINKLLSDDKIWSTGQKDENLNVDLNRIIPNCSITIIDIEPIVDISSTKRHQNPQQPQQWCVQRLQLPNIDHLLETEIATTTRSAISRNNKQEEVLATQQ